MTAFRFGLEKTATELRSPPAAKVSSFVPKLTFLSRISVTIGSFYRKTMLFPLAYYLL